MFQVDEKTKELLAGLLAYTNVKPEWKTPEAPEAMPVIPPGFIKNSKVLNYFWLVTPVGTPRTIAAQELRIECTACSLTTRSSV